MSQSLDEYDLGNYGLHIINFRSIFNESYKHIINDLFEYDIYHDVNARKQDTKKIYYYHLIKQLCDTVMSVKTNNRLIIYYCDKDIQCDFKHCQNKRRRHGTKKADSRSEFTLFMSRFFKQLKYILPIRLYSGGVKFNTFVQYYNTNKGKYLDIINDLRSIKVRKNFDFQRLKTFTQKYKLVYLTDDYFNQMKVKAIMYK